jgi:hypothetical protein
VPYRTGAVAGLAKANMDQLGGAILAAGLMDAAELERSLDLGQVRLFLSRVDGADFGVGTAATGITFELMDHGGRCQS